MAASAVETARSNPDDLFKYQNDCDRPGYRDFSHENKRFENVFNVYANMHANQCVEFVQQMRKKWLNFEHGEYAIMEILEKLSDFEDECDPDVDFPNSFHAFQTAEGLRKKYPDKDWLHLCGFIHDLGKIMAIWGEPQYATVGDTFVVGAEFAPSIVYRETTFQNNPDLNDPRYNTKFGVYKPNCGLDNVLMSWGHDEYLYQVLKHNNCNIPEEGLYCIRYHSFYPWHTGGDYDHFCSDKDREMKPWILKFNEHDLYTKSRDFPDMEELRPYYQSLIDKYTPGKLKW
ncbi:unnamed protein product [Clavelina lepadiformis]|uniref:Inositol oxygenase n=1 Tax=Clavelina lepadiformis TaxID=159417 RepID=A0ABP0GRI1_CLALP